MLGRYRTPADRRALVIGCCVPRVYSYFQHGVVSASHQRWCYGVAPLGAMVTPLCSHQLCCYRVTTSTAVRHCREDCCQRRSLKPPQATHFRLAQVQDRLSTCAKRMCLFVGQRLFGVSRISFFRGEPNACDLSLNVQRLW